MTPLQAHLICVALVAADLVARAWRIQWLIQGLGHRISFRDSFVLNAFGDAACALTPLRIGGEPARLAGMLRSKVPATAAFVAISLEVIAAWPVILIAAGWLIWQYAPAWWTLAGPRLGAAAVAAWPWVVLVAALSLIAWRKARKIASPAARQLRRPIRRALVYWRRMPRWPLIASIPLSFINLATRVAILPVLALALPSPAHNDTAIAPRATATPRTFLRPIQLPLSLSYAPVTSIRGCQRVARRSASATAR